MVSEQVAQGLIQSCLCRLHQFSNLLGQPVLLLGSPHSENGFMGYGFLQPLCLVRASVLDLDSVLCVAYQVVLQFDFWKKGI